LTAADEAHPRAAAAQARACKSAGQRHACDLAALGRDSKAQIFFILILFNLIF